MGEPKQLPKPEDAVTGVTPGWQSGVGASFPVPEKDKPRVRQAGEAGERPAKRRRRSTSRP